MTGLVNIFCHFFFFGGGGAEGVLESWTFENFGVLNLKSNVARDSKLS